jgi:hypothetical protein
VPAGALTPIEKVLLLQEAPVFADITPDEMRHLTSVAREVQMNEGSMLFTESDPSTVWVMLAGRALRIEREELLELFGQRPKMLQEVLSALFQGLAEPAGPPAAGVAVV